MGLRPPIGTTMDPRAGLSPSQADSDKPPAPAQGPQQQEAAKQEPAKPEAAKPEPAKPEPAKAEPEKAEPPKEQQQAALAPPPPAPPAPPALEKACRLEHRHAQTSREIARPAPPRRRDRHRNPHRGQPPLPHALAPSPLCARLSRARRRAAGATIALAAQSADVYGQRKAQEDHLRVVRKIATHRYYPKTARQNSEEGLSWQYSPLPTAVARHDLQIAVTALDNAVLGHLAGRAHPAPNDVPRPAHSFAAQYRRNDAVAGPRDDRPPPIRPHVEQDRRDLRRQSRSSATADIPPRSRWRSCCMPGRRSDLVAFAAATA
jgi:hypothetical protein